MFELDNIKEIRKDSFKTQKELADYLGISYYAYIKYEEKQTIPSLEVIFNFSKFYNLSIDYVLGTIEQRTKASYDKFKKSLIANNLKALRLSKNLSQRGLALKLNITQAAIQRYENALSNPSLRIIFKYYKYFNFKINDLCTKDFYQVLKVNK